MWESLRQFLNDVGKFLLGIMTRQKITPSPEPPPPTPVPSPTPSPPPSTNKPHRLMYDSVTARDIPIDAKMVGGYIDGLYKWSGSDWSRFRNSIHVRIAVSPFTNDGHVLDVESGDATPVQSVDWVLMRRRAGTDPSLYFSRSLYGKVKAAFDARGVPMPHVWAAEWTGVRHSVPGANATQYDHPPHSGGHYDLSDVDPVWPGVDNFQ